MGLDGHAVPVPVRLNLRDDSSSVLGVKGQATSTGVNGDELQRSRLGAP